MKPGEFVGADGRTYIVAKGPGDICIRLSGCEWGGKWIGFGHVDYSVALQSLLPKPSVHPAVGLRYCEEGEAFEWEIGPNYFKRRWAGEVLIYTHMKQWIPCGDEETAAFHAGREYERRQG